MQTRSKTTQNQNQPSLVVTEEIKTQTTPVASNIPASNTSASTATIEFTIKEPEVNKKSPNTRAKPNIKSNILSRCIGRIASHMNTKNPAINATVEPATKEPEANKKPSNTRAKSNAKANILSRCIGRIASHMNTRSKTKAAASKPSVAKPEPEVNKKPMNTRSKATTSNTASSKTVSSQHYPNSTIEFTIQELEENNTQNRSPHKIKCVIQIYLENSESL
jgi:hypothetical protein